MPSEARGDKLPTKTVVLRGSEAGGSSLRALMKDTGPEGVAGVATLGLEAVDVAEGGWDCLVGV
jgi:hypothetical protein